MTTAAAGTFAPTHRTNDTQARKAVCVNGMMVHVPQEEILPDALDPLDEFARERLLNSEIKLIDHIDPIDTTGHLAAALSPRSGGWGSAESPLRARPIG